MKLSICGHQNEKMVETLLAAPLVKRGRLLSCLYLHLLKNSFLKIECKDTKWCQPIGSMTLCLIIEIGKFVNTGSDISS